jgi:hypothetical protein
MAKDPASFPFPNIAGPERPRIWTPMEIIALACMPGKMSPNDSRPEVWCQVVLIESGGDPLVRGKTIWAPGNAIHLSHALGMFQLMRRWHVEAEAYPGLAPMTEAETFDPFKAFERAWILMNKDRPDSYHYNYTPWSGFTNGLYDTSVRRANARDGMTQYRAWLLS